MSPDGSLGADSLPPYAKATGQPLLAGTGEAAFTFPNDYREAKSHFERSYLHAILKRFDGRINLTARETGLSKVTLIEKIRRYEIDVKRIKYGAHVQEKS